MVSRTAAIADGVRQLAAIDFWQEAGFTLREISELALQPSASVGSAKAVAAERIAELERIIEDATHVKAFLHHVLGRVHEELGECPQYQEHIQLRAASITGGTHRRQHQLHLQHIHHEHARRRR
ncbi:MAG: MerR family DNA-binding protein [Streptosporangiales bacterium]|nr:MerR family DNA-binding protein [Streptosporangiales bacterium]